MGDYIVRDSSVIPNTHAFAAHIEKDTCVRIGIVREVREGADKQPIYMVEVLMDGKMVIVGCTLMTRFGGAHNFEEYQVRPWTFTGAEIALPTAGAEYKTRAGDVVVVAYLNGKSREGVILGGIRHDSRKPKLKKGSIGYLSEFNGLETSIKEDGTYKVTFKGYSINNVAALSTPPKGFAVLPPVYNKAIGGSFFGFDSKGSYIVSDGALIPGPQFIKINKNPLTGSIILKSGSAVIELGGNLAIPNFSVKAGAGVMDFATTASIKSNLSMAVESKLFSIKATSIAIGNSSFELMKGLSDLIDALGTVIVTSPVGTCTPLSASPTWIQVLNFKKGVLGLSILASLQDAKSFKLSGNDSTTIESLG